MCIQGGLPGFFGSQQMWFVTVAYANHGPLGGRCCWPGFSSTMSLLHSDSSHLSLKFQLLYLCSCEEGRASTQSLCFLFFPRKYMAPSLWSKLYSCPEETRPMDPWLQGGLQVQHFLFSLQREPAGSRGGALSGVSQQNWPQLSAGTRIFSLVFVSYCCCNKLLPI